MFALLSGIKNYIPNLFPFIHHKTSSEYNDKMSKSYSLKPFFQVDKWVILRSLALACGHNSIPPGLSVFLHL